MLLYQDKLPLKYVLKKKVEKKANDLLDHFANADKAFNTLLKYSTLSKVVVSNETDSTSSSDKVVVPVDDNNVLVNDGDVKVTVPAKDGTPQVGMLLSVEGMCVGWYPCVRWLKGSGEKKGSALR